jgi:hypothetical protein
LQWILTCQSYSTVGESTCSLWRAAMAGKTLTPFCLHVRAFRSKLVSATPPSSTNKTVFKIYRSGNRTGNPMCPLALAFVSCHTTSARLATCPTDFALWLTGLRWLAWPAAHPSQHRLVAEPLDKPCQSSQSTAKDILTWFSGSYAPPASGQSVEQLRDPPHSA